MPQSQHHQEKVYPKLERIFYVCFTLILASILLLSIFATLQNTRVPTQADFIQSGSEGMSTITGGGGNYRQALPGTGGSSGGNSGGSSGGSQSGSNSVSSATSTCSLQICGPFLPACKCGSCDEIGFTFGICTNTPMSNSAPQPTTLPKSPSPTQTPSPSKFTCNSQKACIPSPSGLYSNPTCDNECIHGATCEVGLHCSGNQIAGSSRCWDPYNDIDSWCCPRGKCMVNGVCGTCNTQPTPPASTPNPNNTPTSMPNLSPTPFPTALPNVCGVEGGCYNKSPGSSCYSMNSYHCVATGGRDAQGRLNCACEEDARAAVVQGACLPVFMSIGCNCSCPAGYSGNDSQCSSTWLGCGGSCDCTLND